MYFGFERSRNASNALKPIATFL